jgi:UDP-N-acetylmuramoyl-tripeptide--D-alanyl-D-alanine ligase
MAELGDHAPEAHKNLGRAVIHGKFPLLCTVGTAEATMIAEAAATELGGATTTAIHQFPDAAACAEFLRTHATPNDLILVKGSRSAAMEKVIEHFSA